LYQLTMCMCYLCRVLHWFAAGQQAGQVNGRTSAAAANEWHH